MAKKNIVEIGDKKWRLWSKWQDVWGNWQFWWQWQDENGEWQNEANGDIEWGQRMSAHYEVNITGEYAYSESEKNGTKN